MEGLVSTYGVPGYREIDPTLLVAVTFVLMFGIMFGDLGQGLVLAAMGLLLVLRVIPQLAAQAEAGRILVACGLSASVFGLLYGSFFGLEDVVPALWLKPMHDIWTLLGAAIVFGVVVLNIGFGCRLITAMREGPSERRSLTRTASSDCCSIGAWEASCCSSPYAGQCPPGWMRRLSCSSSPCSLPSL